jgi:uncharacterized protein (UPF0248 family)
VKHDPTKDPTQFVIGYRDRFEGLQEIALTDFVPISEGGDIAWSRVEYFREVCAFSLFT